MKAFTLFTTDVLGEMKPRRMSTMDSCKVIPAGGGQRKSAAVAKLERACQDALLEAKLDRAMELLQRIPAARNRPIPDMPGAGPSAFDLMFTPQPSAGELAAQRRAQDWDRICAEAADAYAARNPHKKEYRG